MTALFSNSKKNFFWANLSRKKQTVVIHHYKFCAPNKLTQILSQVIEVLVEVMFTKRNPLLKTDQLKPRPSPGSDYFRDLDWRLDVILSNNHLAKVLQPQVNDAYCFIARLQQLSHFTVNDLMVGVSECPTYQLGSFPINYNLSQF